MKNILTIICILFATSTFAASPDSTKIDTTKYKLDGYISLGLSVTNTSDFLTSSYAGVEGGIIYRDFGAGIVFGRGSLRGLGSKSDVISAYFIEGKISYSCSLNLLTITPFFGYGSYVNTNHTFIEYGVGLSKTFNKVSIGVSYSNWDSVNYLTPNITYNF